MNTILAKIIDYNYIETTDSIIRVVPMNYVNITNFIGYNCFVQLQESNGSYIVTDILQIEEDNNL